MESQKCDICNENYNELNVFSCNHRACNDCFYKICLFNKAKIETYYYETEKDLDITCMLCTLGAIKISKRLISQKLIDNTEKKRKEEEKLCSMHDKELDIFCSVCRIHMCTECFSSHKALPMFKSHDQGKSPIITSSFMKTCQLHDNLPFHYFCLQCNYRLCEICNSTHNIEHKLRFLQDLYNEKKKEFKDLFVLPPHTAEEVSKLLEISEVELKEEINKEVAILKNKINFVIDYLSKTSVQLDKEVEIISEEIEINKTIDKILYNNLIKDLDNISISTEFDINCQYLMKIPKYNCLSNKKLNNNIIAETINEMNNSIDIYNFKTTNKPMLQIDKMCKRILSTDIFNHLTKSILRVNEKNNSISLSHTLAGHTNTISSLIQLQDGKLASGSFDKSIRIWNSQDNFECIHILTEHNHYVSCLIQLQDGNLASGSADMTIKIWDASENFKCIYTLLGHKNFVSSFILLSNGRLASGSYDKTIRIWNPQEKFKCTHIITGHSYYISKLLNLQDGRIASGSWDKTIKIWNPHNDFKCTNTLTGHTSSISCLIQLQDGRMASGSYDNTIRIWDLQDSFKCTNTLIGHSLYVMSLMLLQNDRIASGSIDNTIRIWNPQNNFECSHILTGHSIYVCSLIGLQDERYAYISEDHTIKIWY